MTTEQAMALQQGEPATPAATPVLCVTVHGGLVTSFLGRDLPADLRVFVVDYDDDCREEDGPDVSEMDVDPWTDFDPSDPDQGAARDEVERLLGEAADESPFPLVPAEIHDDLHHQIVHFDALPWLRDASEEELCDLWDNGWTGCKTSDNVALEQETSRPELHAFFEFVRAADLTYEVVVDGDRAEKWLRVFRPDLYAHLTDAEGGGGIADTPPAQDAGKETA